MKPVVEIVWDDHSLTVGEGTPRAVRVTSVGYLLEDTKRHVVIAQSRGETYQDKLLVLRPTLRKMKRIR